MYNSVQLYCLLSDVEGELIVSVNIFNQLWKTHTTSLHVTQSLDDLPYSKFAKLTFQTLFLFPENHNFTTLTMLKMSTSQTCYSS